jgi:hypothetical protein
MDRHESLIVGLANAGGEAVLAELGEGSGTLGGNHCDIRAYLKTFLWNKAVHDRLRWHTDWSVPTVPTGMELVKAFLKRFWTAGIQGKLGHDEERTRPLWPKESRRMARRFSLAQVRRKTGGAGRPTTRRASSWLPDDFDAKNSHCEVRDKASMFKGFGVEAL